MAEKDKKFYWIKLRKDFMESETADFLMSKKDGANYIVLYEMMIFKALNADGKLCNKIGEITVPYNIDKIQRDCRWFTLETVETAIELFLKLGLVKRDENNILTIVDFENLVGNETYWAKRKRAQRRDGIGHCPTICPTNVQFPLISNILYLNSSNSNNIKTYGEFGNVELLDEEIAELVGKYGEDVVCKTMVNLDEYIENTHKHYENHFLTIRQWIERDKKREKKEEKSVDEKMREVFNE